MKVPSDLLKAARESTELATDTAVVTFALEEVLRIKRQQRGVLSIFELARAHEHADLDTPGELTRPAVNILIDNSVWHRLSKSGVLQALASIENPTIVTATPQVLEYCHSARDPNEYRFASRGMASFDRLPLDDECHHIALGFQRALWHDGKVRGAGATDILIAAIAHRHQATVVHYDKNFATLERAVPSFRQRWIAQPGTID
ncbi:PIN domain-containing protein [Aeromicrobium sp. UC242_57]|uniref:PIN domain-containing protein n=1 Tax=Aeromicrobium sp. UC242_57 TaxID=3374624 RepID=UPI0037BFE5D5